MASNTRLARKARTASKVTIRIPGTVSQTPDELANIVAAFALSDGWIERVRLRADRRWYERLHHGPDYDVWVISWLPGQSTGFHDHGVSSGAFIVATGVLEEHRPDGRAHVVRAGKPRAFGPDYAHDVRNLSLAPAISIHAYSPPLTEMNEYKLDGGQLIPRNPDRGLPTSSGINGSACMATRIRDVFVAGASVLSTVEGSMRFVFFRRNVVSFVFLFVLLALFTPNSGHTQQAATSTASLDAKPDTVEWVYRIRYGYHDEWWRIFRKYQIAILERQKQLGYVKDFQVWAPGLHTSEESRWDFRVIITRASHDAPPGQSESEVAKQLFPDGEAFHRDENRRWELTTNHWDLPVHLVDINAPQ